MALALSDRVRSKVKEKFPNVKIWRIFYPMRDEDPIIVEVDPESVSELAGGKQVELELDGRKIVVKHGTRPPRPPARRAEGGEGEAGGQGA